MSEMVERIATAIAFERIVAFERLPPYQQEMLRREARAALKAMREPTEAMEIAAGRDNERDDHLAPAETWTRMIDEALR